MLNGRAALAAEGSNELNQSFLGTPQPEPISENAVGLLLVLHQTVSRKGLWVCDFGQENANLNTGSAASVQNAGIELGFQLLATCGVAIGVHHHFDYPRPKED